MNEIDEELYPDNNDLIVLRPFERTVNETTGDVEEVPITGLTDVRFYIAATESAESHTEAIHAALVVTLTEGPAGVYSGTLSGAAKRTHLGASPDFTELHRHWQSSVTEYHTTTPVIWRVRRQVEAT